MWDVGDDETEEYVILESEKHNTDQMEIMQVILIEMGCDMN